MNEETAGSAPLERGVRPPRPKAQRLTERQLRMQKAIRFMANYMGTYEKQAECLNYTDKTLIDDVLYGLGYALGGKEHQYADGYERWKAKLLAHLAA